MVPPERFELPTLGFEDQYSSTELRRHTILVLPRGIEPRSSVLQTGAMTTSAKAAH